MIERYTMENKPSFVRDQAVQVDMSFLGWVDGPILSGKVVGKGLEHVIDTWLIEFNDTFGPTYPFKVVGIPHVAIVKPTQTS